MIYLTFYSTSSRNNNQKSHFYIWTMSTRNWRLFNV